MVISLNKKFKNSNKLTLYVCTQELNQQTLLYFIQTWFQNRRRRDRKNGVNISKKIDRDIRKRNHPYGFNASIYQY